MPNSRMREIVANLHLLERHIKDRMLDADDILYRIADDLKYLVRETQQPEDATLAMVCVHCGTAGDKPESDDLFCHVCGETTEQVPTILSEHRNKKENRGDND